MDRKISDYVTVVTEDTDQLEKDVKELIQHGWQPFGGVCVTLIGEYQYATWAQAMVKYGEV